MTCQQLAHRIQRLQPDAGARDVARLCLLLANISDDVSKLDDDDCSPRPGAKRACGCKPRPTSTRR